MASDHLISSSKKEEHLQAGKKRLEEFRKKKAKGQGKISTNDLKQSDVPHPQQVQLSCSTEDRVHNGTLETNPSLFNSSNKSVLPCVADGSVLNDASISQLGSDHNTCSEVPIKANDCLDQETNVTYTGSKDIIIHGGFMNDESKTDDSVIVDGSRDTFLDASIISDEVRNTTSPTKNLHGMQSDGAWTSRHMGSDVVAWRSNKFLDNASNPSFSVSLDVTKSSVRGPFFRSFLRSDKDEIDIIRSSEHDETEDFAIQTAADRKDAEPLPGLKSLSSAVKYASSNSSDIGIDTTRPNGSENDPTEKDLRMHNQEDFFALEQHIEDLTQEKFSLQRALETTRVLSESLASENSSLTESYNQQRGVVNQLKSEMERLQEEIKSHLVELESVRTEYANAQLECSAADERAKLLASEVIGLEEKSLRLKSNELKLEKQLEESHTEITLHKRKISSLEKESESLRSRIAALDEDKRILHSKLQKAPSSVLADCTSKKDISTSTNDLEPEIDALGPPHPLENEFAISELSSPYVPLDQLKTIKNIKSLISELASEKEELVRTSAANASLCSKLQEMNKELTRKLELQTQRLELLTAQNMANENPTARLPHPHSIKAISSHVDEDDAVVDRVFGWLMKLFPRGPSRRRTSKLL